MPRSPWLDLGLAWASVPTLAQQGRIARALLRWDGLCPSSRTALRDLVCELVQPPAAVAHELVAWGLAKRDSDAGPCAPDYAGAGLLALDLERRLLAPAEATELVAWYRRGLDALRRIYGPFEADRPRGTEARFAALERQKLVERREGRRYRSTVRGWAVARLVEGAMVPSSFVDEDGPTRPRLRLAAPGEAGPR